jgi:hypothetical protein
LHWDARSLASGHAEGVPLHFDDARMLHRRRDRTGRPLGQRLSSSPPARATNFSTIAVDRIRSPLAYFADVVSTLVVKSSGRPLGASAKAARPVARAAVHSRAVYTRRSKTSLSDRRRFDFSLNRPSRPMSALECITGSSRTSCHVRKVPVSDIPPASCALRNSSQTFNLRRDILL